MEPRASYLRGRLRLSQVPRVGAPLRRALEAVTDIPRLHPYRDLSAPTRGVRRSIGSSGPRARAGLVADSPDRRSAPHHLLLARDRRRRAGLGRVFCVATDTDLNRIWAPAEPRRSRIQYLVPTRRAARRLRSYGVPEDRITFTGFPLPDVLVGGPSLATLEANLAARVVRLDPAGEFRRSRPGGARALPRRAAARGGGAGPARSRSRSAAPERRPGWRRELLPGFRRALEGGTLRICLVAGVRADVDARFREIVQRRAGMEPLLGGALEILLAPTFREYYARFNALLARTDVLWTKPSELTFYGALGIPSCSRRRSVFTKGTTGAGRGRAARA